MSKPTKITILFVMIFCLGVLGFVTYINWSLDKKSVEQVESMEE